MREGPGTESKSDSWEDHAINSLFSSPCPILPLHLSDSLPTPAAVIHYYTQGVTPCFFCLFISPSTTPRSLHANLAPSFCLRDLKQIPEALFSVLYLQASSKSSRPQSSFLIFVSLAKSSTTCKQTCTLGHMHECTC